MYGYSLCKSTQKYWNGKIIRTKNTRHLGHSEKKRYFCNVMIRLIYTLFYMLLTLPSMAQKAGDVLPECRTEAEARQRAARYFTGEEIPDEVFRRMRGKSFPAGCTVKRSDLRYLRMLHRNREGRTQVGEMVCNKAIAGDLLRIFRRLYEEGYRIERMMLIDDYGADDERSMAANNTSCFNFRLVTGSRTRVSKHGMGMAVDINPLYNPYVKGKVVKPAASRPYTRDRGKVPMAIQRGDVCHRLFTRHGFSWGGAWRSLKDYQHFEK